MHDNPYRAEEGGAIRRQRNALLDKFHKLLDSKDVPYPEKVERLRQLIDEALRLHDRLQFRGPR